MSYSAAGKGEGARVRQGFPLNENDSSPGAPLTFMLSMTQCVCCSSSSCFLSSVNAQHFSSWATEQGRGTRPKLIKEECVVWFHAGQVGPQPQPGPSSSVVLVITSQTLEVANVSCLTAGSLSFFPFLPPFFAPAFFPMVDQAQGRRALSSQRSVSLQGGCGVGDERCNVVQFSNISLPSVPPRKYSN